MAIPDPRFARLVARYALERRLLVGRGARPRALSAGACRVLDDVRLRRAAVADGASDPPATELVVGRPRAGGRAQPIRGAAPRGARVGE